MPHRCTWASQSPQEQKYHDEEWGVPVFDDRHLFEMLILEGAQAGLSWSTILNKRENYRRLFDCFDAEKVARYEPQRIDALLADAGIVRNRLKVESAVTNARAFIDLQDRHGSFCVYLWGFVDGAPIRNRWARLEDIPAATPLSDALSKDLRKHGFKFVGSTICYAFMQSVGLVNDHTTDCFRYQEILKMGR